MRFLLTLALCAAAAPVQAPRVLSVAPGSSITYMLIHKLHQVEGTSKAVEGKARLLPNGDLQVMVRSRVDSFDSGNSNRDAHMKEAVEAVRYPMAEFKGATSRFSLPKSFPSTQTITLPGQVTLHGESQSVRVPLKVNFESADRARIEGSFPLSLTAHKVERPALMFVKVDDKVVINLKLLLQK